MPSLYEFAGGEEALHDLEDTFYSSVLKDPLLQPLFGAGKAEHVDHLTAFTAESFGGPDRFTRELGFCVSDRGPSGPSDHRGAATAIRSAVHGSPRCLRPSSRSGIPTGDRVTRRNSAAGWQCRTPMPRPMRSCIRSGKSHGGRGLARTRRFELGRLTVPEHIAAPGMVRQFKQALLGRSTELPHEAG